MLIFWNLAGVPLSYCHCTIYLANHHPSEYAWSKPALILLYTSYIFTYWVWDTANSQKNRFRAQERGFETHRKSFPQLPWRAVKNPKKIETETGDSLLCDGWYGLARKIHYTCDLYFAITWGLITGFNSPFPWFYPAFFSVMIVHRAYRDIQRCRERYGEAWKEYERRVPYLFIPVSLILMRSGPPNTDSCAVCYISSYLQEPTIEGDNFEVGRGVTYSGCDVQREARSLHRDQRPILYIRLSVWQCVFAIWCRGPFQIKYPVYHLSTFLYK